MFSPGVRKIPGLSAFLGGEVVFRPRSPRGLDAVVGWGHKPTAARARRFAESHGLPYVGLEDGFLRSVGLGADDPPLSLVVDDEGIYYDARQPSRLESMLERGGFDVPLLQRASCLRQRLRDVPLSKYNHAPTEVPERWRRRDRPTVLVVDQTFGDASVQQGLAMAQTFDRMLEAARDEHPGARVLVKVHPETTTGRKRGYLAGSGLDEIDAALHPVSLLEQIDAVYVVTSQLGFEAVLMGLPVRCFGVPFYAGWGLTDDDQPAPRRTRRCTVDELAAAALLAYPRYRHPVRDERCEAEDVVEHLALQRRRLLDNERRFHCVGFTTWKRPFVRAYLGTLGDRRGEGPRVRFLRRERLNQETFDDDSVIVVWGQRAHVGVRRPDGAPVPVWRMEDGFLRSVRLGSQLSPPGSLVLDRRGLYYDPRTPSDLEQLLTDHAFTDAERAEARALREAILQARISKYNLAPEAPFHPRATGKPVILAVGQVDDDASVRLGSPVVQSNAALLRATRRLRPQAHLVYKPHPDVLSGNRQGQLDRCAALCDEVVVDRSVDACLEVADEVHTMTSLVGFEALLRGRRVVVHGQPFYAGWGLTHDLHPPPRRGRDLSLDELVAGAYLLYPRYFSWEAQAFCTAQDKVAELARERATAAAEGFTSPWIVRRVRDLAILLKEWARAR